MSEKTEKNRRRKWREFSIYLPKSKRVLETPIDLYAVFNSRLKALDFMHFMFENAVKMYEVSGVKAIKLVIEKESVYVDLVWMLKQIIDWIISENEIKDEETKREIEHYIVQYFLAFDKNFDRNIRRFLLLHFDLNLNILQSRIAVTNQKTEHYGAQNIDDIAYYFDMVFEDSDSEKLYAIKSIRFSLVMLRRIAENYECVEKHEEILDELIDAYDHDALKVLKAARGAGRFNKSDTPKLLLYKFNLSNDG